MAARDDPSTGAAFTKALKAAAALAPFAERLTCDDARKAYAEASAAPRDDALFTAYGELEGVIAGYRGSDGARLGPHMVVDVGASTLDVATFELWSREGEDVADVFEARVDLLGAEALRWATAAGVPAPTFKRACAYRVWEDCFRTTAAKNHDRRFNRAVSDDPIPFLFVGGGRHTPLHADLFTYAGKDAYLGAKVDTPTPAGAVTRDTTTDFARLLVAFGLSRHESRIAECRLPSHQKPVPQITRDFTDRYPSKDHG